GHFVVLPAGSRRPMPLPMPKGIPGWGLPGQLSAKGSKPAPWRPARVTYVLSRAVRARNRVRTQSLYSRHRLLPVRDRSEVGTRHGLRPVGDRSEVGPRPAESTPKPLIPSLWDSKRRQPVSSSQGLQADRLSTNAFARHGYTTGGLA